MPRRSPAVLMVPGSGPSDRHNDTFFPPIREHLRTKERDAILDWLGRGAPLVQQALTIARLATERPKKDIDRVAIPPGDGVTSVDTTSAETTAGPAGGCCARAVS